MAPIRPCCWSISRRTRCGRCARSRRRAPSTTLSVASDGTLFGTLSLRGRFHCNPATGDVVASGLPPEIGRVAEPFTTVPSDGLSYGAASVRWAGRSAARCSAGAAAGTPPALDSDTDGLPNMWETAYGLDPFVRRRRQRRRRRSRRRRPHQRAGARRRHASARHVTRLLRRGRHQRVLPHDDSISSTRSGHPAIVARPLPDRRGVTVAPDVIVPPSSHIGDRSGDAARPANATFSTIFESDTRSPSIGR